MDKAIVEKANEWLQGNYDEATKLAIRTMQAENEKELAESFYRNLEFGTGGLRGIMGVGTNRMNKYTVGMATQGFSNYLKKVYGEEVISVAIAHDCRNNSRFFAETTANVFAANGIKVFLFESLRPTPELSFAIRHLGCKAGVVCTASHNPKEYNGYKAYWNDGSQLVPPHDKNVIKEVDAIASVNDVLWTGGEANITIIGKDLDDAYMNMVKGLSIYPEVIQQQHDLKIVYTPIHGTGITIVPETLMSPVCPASRTISPFFMETLRACTSPALLITLAATPEATRAVMRTRPPSAINWPLEVLAIPLPCAVAGSSPR